MHKSEGEVKDKDDTLCDILASVAFDKYQSDFESTYYIMRLKYLSCFTYIFLSILKFYLNFSNIFILCRCNR